MADEADYENMATDICDCVNKNTTGISDGMKNTFVDAMKNGKDFQAAVTEYVMKNPEVGMKDAEAMTQLESGMESCMNDLEKKYDKVYSNETEEEVQKKLVAKLEENKDCSFTYAIVKLGMQEMAKK
jgi:uncharacterized protein YifE (UPF0438 family)